MRVFCEREPVGAAVLLDGIFLLSGAGAGLEVGLKVEDLSVVGWGGGELFVLVLSVLFVEDRGGFVLVFFDELLSVDGWGVLLLEPEGGEVVAIYLLFWRGS